MTDKIIRNASLEEIEKLKKSTAVEGIPASQAQQATVTEIKSMKPKQSMFEPEPIPVKLPSGNKVVKRFLTPKNEVFVKRMGSQEEALFIKLVKAADEALINATMDSVIDNCLKTNISSGELSLIDKFAVFFKIIHATYGLIDMEIMHDGLPYNIKVNLETDLNTTYVPNDVEYPHPIKLKSYSFCDLIWYVKYPTIRDTQKFLQDESIDSMLYLTDRLEGTVTETTGEVRQVREEDYEEIIKWIDDDDRKAFKDFLAYFGGFGTQLNFKKSIKIENTNAHKEVEIELPLENIFKRILSIN